MEPKPSRKGLYLPYRSIEGTRLPLPSRLLGRFPGVLVYSLGTSILFLVFAAAYHFQTQPWMEIFLYRVPLLFTDLPRFLVSVVAAPWLNHHPIQLGYVLILLGLFGIAIEVREGTRRAILLFYATNTVAGIAAGILLAGIQLVGDAGWITKAWEQPWVGGSAGCFGLMGAFAARARRPWMLLAAFLVWEINVEIWHLRSFTIAFHMIAMATGFWMVRRYLPAHPLSASSPTVPSVEPAPGFQNG